MPHAAVVAAASAAAGIGFESVLPCPLWELSVVGGVEVVGVAGPCPQH